jgi:hypothetical protein
MDAGDQGGAGALVLRAWVEDGRALRVRITGVDGWDQPGTVFAASIDETCSIVTAWLEGLLEADGVAGRDGGSG